MRVRNFIETRYIFSDNKRKQANSIAICCFSQLKVEKTCVCCRRNQKTEKMYLTKQKLPWSKLNTLHFQTKTYENVKIQVISKPVSV